MPSRHLLLAGLLALAASSLCSCAAEGTDLEALPFYREDRTTPGEVHASVPPLLLSLDAGDAQIMDEQGEPVQNEDGSPKLEPRSIVRVPWPLGMFIKRGTHITYDLTLPALLPNVVTAGPLGRALSPDAAIREDVLANLAPDAKSGGLSLWAATFYDHRIDHNNLPDMEDRGPDLDEDIGLLPFFAWGGGSKEEDSYLAVFPFGGVTKGILGKKKITWWGFPLPAYAKVEDRAYTSTHIAWPFINWIDGPRHHGWRVLPFYGHYEHTDSWGRPVYERSFLMWPFLTWQTTGMNDPQGPTSIFFFFPFYGRIDGPHRDQWTFLWPFFRYERDASRDTWELRAPFPFLQIAGGPDRYKFDLWPLFGVKGRPGFTRNFVAWPIWRYESLQQEDANFDGEWFLPLFWRTHWEWPQKGQEETRIRLYPFLHYRALRDGSVEFAALSPFYHDSPQGFERTIAPFLRIYRYTRDANGGVEHQALLGLFSWRSLPALEPTALRPGRPAYWRLSLLFGLFQLRSLGDEGGLRLLYLPEITWGQRPPGLE